MKKIILISLSIIGFALLVFPSAKLKFIGSIISFYVLPIALILNQNTTFNNNKKKVFNLVKPLILFSIAFQLLGILFKIMHYPGAVLMKMGMIILATIAGILLAITLIKTKKGNANFNSEITMFIILFISISGQFLPFTYKIDSRESQFKQFSQTNIQLESTIKNHLDTTCKNYDLIVELEEFKKKMIKNSGGLNENGYPYGFFDKDVVMLSLKGETKGIIIDSDIGLTEQSFNGLNLGESLMIITSLETQLLLDCK